MGTHLRRGWRGRVLLAALVILAACSDDDGTFDESDDEPPADSGRCDLGFNTAAYNETAEQVDHFHDEHGPGMSGHHTIDYTIDEWAEVFADPSLGVSGEGLADLVRGIPAFEAAVTGGGLTASLAPEPWLPMSDTTECETLAAELRRTRDAVLRYPTVAAAEAGGFTQSSPMSPGQGAHYTRPDWIAGATVNLDQPAQLMFAGTRPESPLVGLAYLAIPPEGVTPDAFTGPNDRFHVHPNSCAGADGIVMSSDTTEEECKAAGGTFTDIPGDGLFMLHTWLVPGCESDWGLYSNANPNVPWVPPDAAFAAGCNSGVALTDPLTLADPGSGPAI